MRKQKVLMIAAMHKRPLISELWCISATKALAYSNKNTHISAQAVAIVSDQESQDMCSRYNIPTIVTVAAPVGRKFNEGFCKALERYEFDYLISIGDDDIFPPNILEFYDFAMEENLPYFGTDQVFFYDAFRDEAMRFRYAYSAPKLMGAGRMFRRDALERAGWKVTVSARQTRTYSGLVLRRGIAITIPEYKADYIIGMKVADKFQPRKFSLWRDDQVNGLDHESEMSMVMAGYVPVVLERQWVEKMKSIGDGPFFTDVKSNVNIWSFDHFRKFSVPATVDEATHFFTQEQREIIKEIRSRQNCMAL